MIEEVGRIPIERDSLYHEIKSEEPVKKQGPRFTAIPVASV
jgi:2-iminoacetate synthase ThiH